MNEIKHYGVLGMKWGKRKNINDTTSSGKKLDKKDSKWLKKISKKDPTIAVYNRAADKINPKIESFNKEWAKTKYADLNKKSNHDKYLDSYKKLFDSMLNESVDELFSSVSPTGSFKLVASTEGPGGLPVFQLLDIDS
jgi:hypothetical protein